MSENFACYLDLGDLVLLEECATNMPLGLLSLSLVQNEHYYWSFFLTQLSSRCIPGGREVSTVNCATEFGVSRCISTLTPSVRGCCGRQKMRCLPYIEYHFVCTAQERKKNVLRDKARDFDFRVEIVE